MNMEKIKEVFSDEGFVKSLFALETAAEVQSALKKRGIEMSEEEILSMRELLVKVDSGEISQEQLESWQKQAEDGELPEEALENVAGGSLIATISMFVGMAIGLAAIGGTGYAVDTVVKDTTGRHW